MKLDQGLRGLLAFFLNHWPTYEFRLRKIPVDVFETEQ